MASFSLWRSEILFSNIHRATFLFKTQICFSPSGQQFRLSARHKLPLHTKSSFSCIICRALNKSLLCFGAQSDWGRIVSNSMTVFLQGSQKAIFEVIESLFVSFYMNDIISELRSVWSEHIWRHCLGNLKTSESTFAPAVPNNVLTSTVGY